MYQGPNVEFATKNVKLKFNLTLQENNKLYSYIYTFLMNGELSLLTEWNHSKTTMKLNFVKTLPREYDTLKIKILYKSKIFCLYTEYLSTIH